jgi:hypothetical protein
MLLRFLLAAALLATAVGCSDTTETPPVDTPPEDPQPTAPAANDPEYDVQASRLWMLIGDDLTAGHDTLSLTVVAPAGVERVVPWLGNVAGDAAERDGQVFTAQVDVTALDAGEHQVLLAADGGEVALAAVPFVRSHPLYVVLTVDWDHADIADDELAWHGLLHSQFPELRITQLVGPYTFTDPAVSSERAAEISTWLLGMREMHADEIGLHIHPYCSFVESAGVTCRHEPSVVDSSPDPSGYAVECSAYPQAEFEQLLQHADALFEQNGLGKPTSFRAGAWTADDEVLKALAATGYVADSSANNWQRLEEWTTPAVAPIYDWNMQHWSDIGDTSQPYFPSEANVQVPGEPAIAILEVPDNGSLVDYVSEEEMTQIFTANWSGGALHESKAFSIGFHNRTQFLERLRMEATLEYVSTFAASADAGPVVFTTLSETALVWQRE